MKGLRSEGIGEGVMDSCLTEPGPPDASGCIRTDDIAGDAIEAAGDGVFNDAMASGV